LLGSACLRIGDFGGALTYFRLAHETKRRDPLAILGLAALYLRRSETDRAIDYYLDVLDIDHKNRIAKKAMKIIRRQAGTDAFSAWLEAGKLPTLYPPVPFPGFSGKERLAALITLLIVCVIAFGVLLRFKVIPNPFKPQGPRQGMAEFNLTREERMEPLETGGTYRYVLTRVQALETYERALSLFTSYRDEAARIDINRLLESNASEGLKNRARIIASYMEPPGFDPFRRSDNTEYADAIKDPVLYRDVHVIWRGMATNVETSAAMTTFDFLVGYDTRRILEGIVPVAFDRALAIDPERPLEVLGRIVPGGAETPIILTGISIHQTGLLEN
jgi:tetratricopeptide (TPR) repeat protein